MAENDTSLQGDFEVYERNRREWAASHASEFAVIQNCSLVGFYPDYESALRSGLKKFGVAGRFLVKQVCAEEPVFVIY